MSRRDGRNPLGYITDAIYVAIEDGGLNRWRDFTLGDCTEVHVRSKQVMVTLVGEHVNRCNLPLRLSASLTQRSALILPQNDADCSLRITVAEAHLPACIQILQRTFFADVDPAFFASAEIVPEEQQLTKTSAAWVGWQHEVFTSRFAFPGAGYHQLQPAPGERRR